MSTAASEAPDISALGASPALETAAPETDPFKQSIRSATKELPSPDDVEAAGAKQPPEKVATALQKLRADVSSAFHDVAEDYPDEAYAKRAKLNEDFNDRIAKQRDAATAQWAQATFKDESQFQDFAKTWDTDPEMAANIDPSAAEGLTKILEHPAFRPIHAGPLARLKGDDGTDYGWYQTHPDMHGGYDVHVQLNNGKKSGHFKISGKADKETITKAFTESKIAKHAGNIGLGAFAGDLARGIGTAGLNVASGATSLVGAKETSEALRHKSEEVRKAYPGTTAPTTAGHLLRETGELAGRLPIWTLPGGFPAELAASADVRGKEMADEIQVMADAEPDQEKKNVLQSKANQFRDNAWLYGLASAATGMAAGKLLSLPIAGVVKLLPKATQAAFAEKLATLGGTIAAETANITAMELIQGQAVDPVFGYDRAPLSNLINPGNLLFGAVFGAKRYRAGAGARAAKEKTESAAKEVEAGKITSPQQIFDAIHGKAEETESAPAQGDLTTAEHTRWQELQRKSVDGTITPDEIRERQGYARRNRESLAETVPELAATTDELTTTRDQSAAPKKYDRNLLTPDEWSEYQSLINSDHWISGDSSRVTELERKMEVKEAEPIAPESVDSSTESAGLKTELPKDTTTDGASAGVADFEFLAHGADLIHKGITDFARWSREMIRRFGAAIQNRLKEIWKGAVQYYYDVIKPAGGFIAQPARKFQDTTKAPAPRKLSRREREAEVEPLRQAFNEHAGEVNAGNMAFDALQKEREKEGVKLDKTKFEKDSLLGAAIHVYRQVKGDTAILTDQRDKLRTEGGSQYVPVWDKALRLTAAEKSMADKISADYGENAFSAQGAGIDIEANEAYGKQIWDLKNNRGKSGFGEFLSRFDSDPSSFKKRKHATSFDGIMAGLTPATLDDFKLVSVNGKEINRAIASRKLAQTLPELRDSRGRPFAIIDSDSAVKMDDGAVARLRALAASGVAIPVQMRKYTPYQRFAVGGSPVLHFDPTGYKPAGGRGIQGYYYQLPAKDGSGMQNFHGRLIFSPSAHPYANARTAPSMIRERASRGDLPATALKTAIFLNREIKASLLGALSAFHYVQEGFHGIGHATNPLWNLPPVDPLNPDHLQWMKSGLMLGGEHDAIQYFDGGGNLDALFYRIPVLGFLSKKMSEHLFLRYIPALKLKTAQNAHARNAKRFEAQLKSGKMSEADVRHITSTAVNDAYGHINWADLGIGKSMRDFLQLTALAPDFLLARMRFAAQAMGVQRLRGVDASRSGREAFMAFFALAAGQWITARIANYILNDGDMRTDLKDLFAVVDKKSGRRYTLRSVPGDLLEAIEKPAEFFNNRASPLVRDLYNTIMGTNWRGDQVGHAAALTDAIIGAAPITVQPLVRGLTTTGQQSPTTRKEDFSRSFGLKINRWSQLGEAKSKAHDYMKSHGAKTGTDFHHPSVYNPMLFNLIDGDEEGAKAELDKLTTGDHRQIERVVKGFHASLFRHFTGDAAHEVNFRREIGKTDEGKQLFKDADRQRLDAWKLFLKVGQVSGELRQKYPGKLAEPTDATLAKALDLRLQESR